MYDGSADTRSGFTVRSVMNDTDSKRIDLFDYDQCEM